MTTWTDAMIARLKVLHSDDLPFSAIAARMSTDFNIKLSRNAAIGKAARIGLSSPKKPSNVTVTRQRKRAYTARVARKPSLLDQALELTEHEAVDLPADQSDFAVVFEQLRDPHCRWPIGDPAADDFKYCGADKMREGPYCARHHRLAYHQPQRLSVEERARRVRQAQRNNAARASA